MNETLDRLRAFSSRLLLTIHGIADADLRRVEADGKWAILDVIAHLSDLELVYSVRMRDILGGSGERILQKLPQNDWIARVHRKSESLAELIEQFSFHRRMNVALFERLSDEELDRTGIHPDYGPISIRDIAGRLERHDAKHLAQIERVKTRHGFRASDTPDVSGVLAGSLRAERSPGPGVTVRELWADGVKRALEVEFAPGAQWPGIDYHVPGPEEVYVLAGDFDDGANVYRAGTFLHHPAGSSHSPTSLEGCRLFVFYPEG